MFQNSCRLLISKAPLNDTRNLHEPEFTKRLIETSTEKCNNYLKGTEYEGKISNCQKNMIISSSCVLLIKANTNFGDSLNSYGDCKYQIDLAKEDLAKHYKNFPYKRFDNYLRNLSLDIHNFA